MKVTIPVSLIFLFSVLLACNKVNPPPSTESSDGIQIGDDRGAGGGDSGGDSSQPKDPADPSNPAGLDSEELAFLKQINDYRAQNGLAPLAVSVTLSNAASWMAEDMATKAYLDHTDSLGRSFSTRIRSFGYTASSTIGENIAYGNETAQGTFGQWRNSSGHNANMLGASYKAIGIGRFNHSGTSWGWYWATDFGGKAD